MRNIGLIIVFISLSLILYLNINVYSSMYKNKEVANIFNIFFQNKTLNINNNNQNNFPILEINNKNVKISREALRYEVLDPSLLDSSDVKEFSEVVVETISYNTIIPINIDSIKPGESCDQDRYYYNIKFVK